MRCTRAEILDARVEAANQVIQAIASCGRKFFRYEDRVAWIERDKRGQLFLHNEWNGKRIYISRYGAWRGFHHGGTLHALVGRLVEYIKTCATVRCTYFDAKHWGYGADMQIVIDAATDAGFVAEPYTEES